MAVIALYLVFLGTIIMLVREKRWLPLAILVVGILAYFVTPGVGQVWILAALALFCMFCLVHGVIIGARRYYALRRL